MFGRGNPNRADPSQLDDPLWGEHKTVTANGIRMHYVERKPERGEDAPLVSCCG
jgi:hypothetical protein